MKLTEFSKKNINEGKMAELDLDLKDKKMSDAEFKKKYKKTREEARTAIKPQKKVKESTLNELSSKTLSSYVKKSDVDADRNMRSGDRKAKAGDTTGALKDFDKTAKRNAGAISARKRLPNMGVKEATGDPKFDKMMGNITGSETPQAIPRQGTGNIDRSIMDLTHKIFLRLRDYDDPAVYQKFVEFMIKTINDDIGPVNEERNMQPARKGPSVDFNKSFDYVKQCITNASLNVPPYNTPEFRIDRIDEAIRRLELLKNLLMADSAIGNASRK